jgi:hypothetical protein
LLEMNTSLSGQVAETLHSIHALQVREDSLQQELNMVKQFMEAAQEDWEQDRIRIMQAEDDTTMVGCSGISRGTWPASTSGFSTSYIYLQAD